MSGHAPASSFTPPHRLRSALPVLLALCVLALGVRLWLGWWKGYLPDLHAYQSWGLDPGEHILPWPNHPLVPCDYPPLYPSVLRLLRWLHRGLSLPGDFPLLMADYSFDPEVHRPILLYLKLVPMLGDLVAGGLLFILGRRLCDGRAGVALAAFYLFSPAILYDSAYWGQTDTLLLAMMFAAVVAWTFHRGFWLGAMLALAPLLKAQAVFFLMVMVFAVVGQWRGVWRRQWKGMLIGAASAVLLTAGLAGLTGYLGQFVDGYRGVGQYPKVTYNALNLWWLLCRPWGWAPAMVDFPPDTHRVGGLVSYRVVGALLFFGTMALILWRLHRARYTPYALALACAAAGWAFFNLPTEMHERYAVPVVGLTCLLPLWDRRWYRPALLAGLTVTVNLAKVAPLFFPPSRLLVDVVNHLIWSEYHWAWTFIAVFHVLLLPLLVTALWRQGGAAQPVPAETGAQIIDTR